MLRDCGTRCKSCEYGWTVSDAHYNLVSLDCHSYLAQLLADQTELLRAVLVPLRDLQPVTW
jgi:hypothetical protein